ncbi:DUF1772 domain-containing protein [Sulfitobacter mediterraneus]|jgi:uncharacterized membrane protein|uniref:anthrone oxygenase family protein n=1 Tax=Sulfitobacter mediterraneus TaxID=83219 RepID=UPI000EA1CD9D|nr:anthrone oxygenase family protein [Sulfitobacter mediterraneus]
MSTTFFFLIQFTILAYALVGGVFLAFSDFVMRSLALTGGVSGVQTMQSINREVFRWIFMVFFIGLAPISLFIAGYGGWVLGGQRGTLMLLAGIIYFVGCFGVTVFFNVPMNEALAGMDAQIDATRAYWEEIYLPRWTFWNSVRTVACAISAALLLFALLWANQLQLA